MAVPAAVAAARVPVVAAVPEAAVVVPEAVSAGLAVVAVVVTGPIRWIALGVAILAAVAAGATLFALRKGSQHL